MAHTYNPIEQNNQQHGTYARSVADYLWGANGPFSAYAADVSDPIRDMGEAYTRYRAAFTNSMESPLYATNIDDISVPPSSGPGSRVTIRQPYTDSAYVSTSSESDSRVTFRQPNTVVHEFEDSDDILRRLRAIEAVLSADPNSAEVIDVNNSERELANTFTSLVHQFDSEAIARGLVDISDPENRALLDLCRRVLKRAEHTARRAAAIKKHNTEVAAKLAAAKSLPEPLGYAHNSQLNARIDALEATLTSRTDTINNKLIETEAHAGAAMGLASNQVERLESLRRRVEMLESEYYKFRDTLYKIYASAQNPR